MLLKDYVSVIRLLKHHVVRETKRRRSSHVGKVRKPLQSNKLIMISRVPGYGQLEYLVLEYLCESQHVTSNKSYWVLMNTFNWD